MSNEDVTDGAEAQSVNPHDTMVSTQPDASAPDAEAQPVPVTIISVMDAPGHGGASHHYRISALGADGNAVEPIGRFARIEFQNGPVSEAGVNGCTIEDLIGVACHRLASFQAGSHPDVDNAMALQHLDGALFHLTQRTAKRLARGVEGTSAA